MQIYIKSREVQFCIKSRLIKDLCFSPTTVYYYWSIFICNLDVVSLLFSLLPISNLNQQVDLGMNKNTCIYLAVAYFLCVTTYDWLIDWFCIINQSLYIHIHTFTRMCAYTHVETLNHVAQIRLRYMIERV